MPIARQRGAMERTQRGKLTVYLRLARASNLPTVASNVLVGLVLGGATPSGWRIARVMLGMCALYAAGMFLNDACDHRCDAARRADRPIPRGDAALVEVFFVGVLLLLTGLRLVAVDLGSGLAALALAGCIVVYDIWHRGNPAGPFVIASCRALVYVAAALAAQGTLGRPVLGGALLLFLYVLGMNAWSRIGGLYVGGLIAGISLLDAILLLCAGAHGPAAIAVVCFIATLRLQRSVPGI